ncbi:MAG: complex I subunit 4 family protein [Mycobacteriales bacterium]
MLDVLLFLPLTAGLVLLAVPVLGDRAARLALAGVTGVELLLAVGLWLAYDGGPGVTGGLAYERRLQWIPSVGSSYHVGVDGLSLPLVGLTAGLFFACALYSLRRTDRPRTFGALMLFLETACLGVFVSQDLLLFFVFFDLSIVGMYFVIAGWGHGQAARSALKFFLYTFLGSLALLVGFLALFAGADPHTFDMVKLAQDPPLQGRPLAGGLALLAIGIGLAVKTPTVPFHTWLPPAHTDAPAVGSAILAGVLLKMGTYGFVRIAMPMLPDAWRTWAVVAVVVGAVGVLYGALVALAQTDLKRMVAYTSVAHMGYVLLAVGAAGMVGGTDEQARTIAVSGAVTQMVSHGLVTGALFLLAGVLQDRAKTYDMAAYGGLATQAPRFAGLFGVACFASLGLPGLSGFLAEFQVLAGSLGSAPVGVVVALLGLLVTAALFLVAMGRLLLGPAGPRTGRVLDLRPSELAAVAPLLVLSLLIGVLPRTVLDLVEPSARAVVELVSR